MTDNLLASLRVFLLIENRLLRDALVRIFRKRSDLIVVGQASSTEEKTLGIRESQCHILVGDFFLPDQHSADFVPSNGGFKTVLVGMENDEAKFMTAVRWGVEGYLLQDASASDVVAAVRAVGRGEAICPPRLCSCWARPPGRWMRRTARGWSTGTSSRGTC